MSSGGGSSLGKACETTLRAPCGCAFGEDRGETHNQIKSFSHSSSQAQGCLAHGESENGNWPQPRRHRQCFIIRSYLQRPGPKYTPVKCYWLTCNESSPSGWPSFPEHACPPRGAAQADLEEGRHPPGNNGQRWGLL